MQTPWACKEHIIIELAHYKYVIQYSLYFFAVNVYLENMTAHVGEKKEYVDNLLSEVAGFAGCEIIRR